MLLLYDVYNIIITETSVGSRSWQILSCFACSFAVKSILTTANNPVLDKIHDCTVISKGGTDRREQLKLVILILLFNHRPWWLGYASAMSWLKNHQIFKYLHAFHFVSPSRRKFTIHRKRTKYCTHPLNQESWRQKQTEKPPFCHWLQYNINVTF